MLLQYVWLLSLATVGRAVDPWEINRTIKFNIQPDSGPATYYLDPSCTQPGKDLSGVIDEVIKMGQEGFNRLRHGFEDIKFGYMKIFKVLPDSDLHLKEEIVMRAFYRIGGMIPAANHADSDIRIYCDNDASTASVQNPDPNNPPRWVPAPDELFPSGPSNNEIPNSQLPFEEQVWIDRVNVMYRSKGDKGVQETSPRTGQFVVFGQTYTHPVPLPTDQNRNRETITMGDKAFEQPPTLDSFSGEDIIRARMSDFETLQSVTLFHELCHSSHILGVFAPPNKDELIGWRVVSNEGDIENIKNTCDSYAFLALYALMCSRNIWIAPGLDGNLIKMDPNHPVTKVKRSSLYSGYQSTDRNPFTSTSHMSPKRAVSFSS